MARDFSRSNQMDRTILSFGHIEIIDWINWRMPVTLPLLLDLQHLLTFRAVVTTGNFTRAAAELGYCQSSVTHHIQVLERSLGTLLLERSRFSKAVLTEAGRRVFDHAERLLALVEEIQAAARKT